MGAIDAVRGALEEAVRLRLTATAVLSFPENADFGLERTAASATRGSVILPH
jgi:hypothetical protein